MKRIHLIDATVGLTALFLLLHVVGFALGVTVPWWTEPDIVDVAPYAALPGDTLRIRGRNFDPRAKIMIGERVLDVERFITSDAVEVKVPIDLAPGHYSISAKNKWNRQGSWVWALTVKPPHVPVLPVSIAENLSPLPPHPVTVAKQKKRTHPSLLARKALPLTPSVIQVNLDPPLIRDVRERSGFTPIPRGKVGVSLLCFLWLEDLVIKPEFTFKGFLQRLPREVRVFATFPERKSFLAEVTLFTEKEVLRPERVVYYVGPSQEIRKGSSFVVVSTYEFKLHAIALEEPVPLRQRHG